MVATATIDCYNSMHKQRLSSQRLQPQRRQSRAAKRKGFPMSTTLPVTSTSIPAGNWTGDAVHSTVGFSAKHMVVSTFRAGFTSFDTRLTSDGNGQVSLTGAVRSASVDIREENLKGHVLTGDFLDAEGHPEITFQASDVRTDGDTVEFTGQLTIKGITHPMVAKGTISGPVEDPFGGMRLGLSLEATIDRTAYEMNWNAPLPSGGFALANDVTLSAQLEFTKDA
jgi:polyisoprenoid-binding protein YceI